MNKVRALIVDDNSTDRMIIKAMLGQLGTPEIQEAEDGHIAEFKITTAAGIGRSFNLILLDWRMPGLNGIEVLKLIRSNRQIKNTVVIIMTATAEPGVVREAAQLGVNDFLVKPFDLNTLKTKLAPHFNT